MPVRDRQAMKAPRTCSGACFQYRSGCTSRNLDMQLTAAANCILMKKRQRRNARICPMPDQSRDKTVTREQDRQPQRWASPQAAMPTTTRCRRVASTLFEAPSFRRLAHHVRGTAGTVSKVFVDQAIGCEIVIVPRFCQKEAVNFPLSWPAWPCAATSGNLFRTHIELVGQSCLRHIDALQSLPCGSRWRAVRVLWRAHRLVRDRHPQRINGTSPE